MCMKILCLPVNILMRWHVSFLGHMTYYRVSIYIYMYRLLFSELGCSDLYIQQLELFVRTMQL